MDKKFRLKEGSLFLDVHFWNLPKDESYIGEKSLLRLSLLAALFIWRPIKLQIIDKLKVYIKKRSQTYALI